MRTLFFKFSVDRVRSLRHICPIEECASVCAVCVYVCMQLYSAWCRFIICIIIIIILASQRAEAFTNLQKHYILFRVLPNSSRASSSIQYLKNGNNTKQKHEENRFNENLFFSSFLCIRLTVW